MNNKKDPRKSVKAKPHVKDEVEHLKKTLDLPTESHVLDYLVRFHKMNKGVISHVNHLKLLKEVDESHKQIRLL
ncbi:hypothetical protein [Paenibacillus agilis]|uniref:Uncharacterized protein n=1 Tax=Paenibacillus agilis TaxID=3020863 RepID=A0A559ID81_9BACL|nr:hypothetical protein [Paenibacillus agilis]TVX85604.1 hypothetical protein FPZ44_24940 [Paenibacillus agilis]